MTDPVRAEAARLGVRLDAARRGLDELARESGGEGHDGHDPDRRTGRHEDERAPEPGPSVAGAVLDSPDTLDALRGLLTPAAGRLDVLAGLVDDLAAGRASEAATLEGLRAVAAAQPVRHPR